MHNLMVELLKISRSYQFINPILCNSVVSHFKYGPPGTMLCQNIFNEWMLSNVIRRDGNVFPFYSTDFKTDFFECEEVFNILLITLKSKRKLKSSELNFFRYYRTLLGS